MKKIFIATHWMEIGGAERSLLGLLDSIDYSEYSVDLFLCRHTGDFLKYIPKEVNLLKEDKKAADIAVPIKQVIINKNYDIAFGRLKSKIVTKIYNIMHKSEKVNIVEIENSNRYTYKYLRDISCHITYDLAISFLEPHYIVANKVKAKKKIAWMHTDYSAISLNIKEGYKVWSNYDNIIAISEECKNSFANIFPNLKDRILIIENIISTNLINRQAKEEITEDYNLRSGDEIILLSIGRFCKAKNFDNIPDIARKIKNMGCNIKWYLIGYGGEEDLIRENIRKNKVENCVIILGKKVNPYPYINQCNIYIQPSRYEGKSVSVREAQILNKPVVITNFKTARSQLIDKFDGIIVPSNNNECAKKIVKFIKDESLREKIIKNIKENNYSNQDEIKKIIKLIN